MNFVGNFLNKFTVLLKDSEDNRQLIIDSITEITKITLKPQDIICREGTIKLLVKPIFKTEIKLKETEILSVINGKLSKKQWQKIT